MPNIPFNNEVTSLGNKVVKTVGRGGRVFETRMQATIVGGPSVMAALAALELRVVKLAAVEALNVAGETIRKEWYDLAPVLDGNFRNSISVKVTARPFGASGDIAVRYLDNLVSHTAHPENEQPYLYAGRLEFGQSGSIRRFGGRLSQQISGTWHARPSARPAFDRSKGAAVDKAAAVLAAAAYAGSI